MAGAMDVRRRVEGFFHTHLDGKESLGSVSLLTTIVLRP
jgi:hypothetical protein